jgi:hypothetical protein
MLGEGGREGRDPAGISIASRVFTQTVAAQVQGHLVEGGSEELGQ